MFEVSLFAETNFLTNDTNMGTGVQTVACHTVRPRYFLSLLSLQPLSPRFLNLQTLVWAFFVSIRFYIIYIN